MFFLLNLNSQNLDSINIVGVLNKEFLKIKPFSNWFNNEYEKYQPDLPIIENLKKLPKEDLKISIYFGSWDENSRKFLPQFIKVLDCINFNEKNLKIYSLPKSLKINNMDTLNIKVVPTTVIVKNKNVSIIEGLWANKIELELHNLIK